jgi:hypothetical protein
MSTIVATDLHIAAGGTAVTSALAPRSSSLSSLRVAPGPTGTGSGQRAPSSNRYDTSRRWRPAGIVESATIVVPYCVGRRISKAFPGRPGSIRNVTSPM